jgi:phosphoglycerate dehydrogenase-like enzyme
MASRSASSAAERGDPRTVRRLVAAAPPRAFEIVRTVAAQSGVDVVPVPGEPGAALERALHDVGFLIVDFEDNDHVHPLISRIPGLEVVQIPLSGTDWIEPHVPAGVALCNASGTRDIPVAEWIVAAILGATSGLLDAVRVQHRRHWEHFQRDEVTGKRVLIVGMGAIGRAAATRLEALGAHVTGVSRRGQYGAEPLTALPELLPRADVVVLLAPLNVETAGMVDDRFLARLRDGALVVNAGRGGLVVTEALMRELESGRLRAVLDVVEPEPMPPDHPLWDSPGVAMSPHIGGDSPQAWERAWHFAGEQLMRWARGDLLLNVVSRV